MWEINVGNQFVTFLYSIALGGMLCFFYDFIRAIKKTSFNTFAAVFFTDIIFCVISAFITFIFLISRTNGEIRCYVLVSEFTGFVLFRFTFSRLVYPFFAFIFKLIDKLCVNIRCVFYGFNRKTETIIFKIGIQTSKKLKRSVKSIKKLLKNRCKMLYTNEK